MKIQAEPSSIRRPLTALAVASVALLLPSPATAVGLKLRQTSTRGDPPKDDKAKDDKAAWKNMNPMPAPAPASGPAPAPFPMAGSPYPAAKGDVVTLRYELGALNYSTVEHNNTLRMEVVHAIQDGVIEGLNNHTIGPGDLHMTIDDKNDAADVTDDVTDKEKSKEASGVEEVLGDAPIMLAAKRHPPCPCPRKVSLLQQQPYCPCMPASPYPAPSPFPAPGPAPVAPYTRADIEVVLSAGSIVADVTIKPHPGTPAEQLFGVMDLHTMDKIATKVKDNVMAMPDVGKMLEKCKRLADIALKASLPKVIDSMAPKPVIRPGIVVQVCESNAELKQAFQTTPQIIYDPLMEDMLGKTFVVKEMNYGGAGLRSPKNADVWYFPIKALTPWLDTPAGKAPPVAGKAMTASGMPSNPRINVREPGRNDAPWHYRIARDSRGLLDPVAPPYNERVDLNKGRDFPPWMKVKQVVSIECMEKMQKDPKVICNPEDYLDYRKVTPIPTTSAPPTKEEVEALKKKIKHLKGTIESMSPTIPTTTVEVKEALGTETHPVSMNAAGGVGNEPPVDSDNHQMDVYNKGSDARLNTANGQWRNLPVADKPKANKKME